MADIQNNPDDKLPLAHNGANTDAPALVKPPSRLRFIPLIGRVSIGDPVTISAEALAQPLSGTVHAIGLEIGRQSITSDDPAANTDARVVDVIIWLDAGSTARAANFTNLETVVRIDAGKAL